MPFISLMAVHPLKVLFSRYLVNIQFCFRILCIFVEFLGPFICYVHKEGQGHLICVWVCIAREGLPPNKFIILATTYADL